jgi:hypothetical protein
VRKTKSVSPGKKKKEKRKKRRKKDKGILELWQ